MASLRPTGDLSAGFCSLFPPRKRTFSLWLRLTPYTPTIPQENLLRKTLKVSECGPVYSDGGRPYEVIIKGSSPDSRKNAR